MIKLSTVIEALEMVSTDSYTAIDIRTGEILYFSIYDKEYNPVVDENDPNIFYLPDSYDIHIYQIMKNFALSIEDERIRDSLLDALHGKGAFARFRNEISYFDIEQNWYDYRDNAIKEIAIEWCKENNIEYEL